MSSTNLNPEQRKAARRVRQALSYVGEPERRVILAALKEWFQAATAPLLGAIEQRNADLERQMAEEHAMLLALEERLGHAPEDGEDITLSDQLRAQEILALYPRTGGE